MPTYQITYEGREAEHHQQQIRGGSIKARYVCQHRRDEGVGRKACTETEDRHAHHGQNDLMAEGTKLFNWAATALGVKRRYPARNGKQGEYGDGGYGIER